MSGTVTHLCIAPDFGRRIESVDAVDAVEGKGLAGDRYFGTTRQVTLVCTGELEAAARELGMAEIPAGATRRNITVSTEGLPRVHGARIRLGEVELAVWRDCTPCDRMETEVGPGAQRALELRAGVSATVITGGTIRLGDPVVLLDKV